MTDDIEARLRRFEAACYAGMHEDVAAGVVAEVRALLALLDLCYGKREEA